MAVAMRTNGLHHAVSLGTIEVSSKSAYTSSHLDRSYDSEDENMSRRRLKHTSSTELYPKPSVYSKGDIREQYCLTDRQLNTIERPRGRDRLFGCLSRRSTQQSFLGVCVGRRAPSDENLAADAPFYRYPRYRHQSPDYDLETSYFRRQPASILSTSKMVNDSSNASVSSEGRYTWSGARKVDAPTGFSATEQSSFHCPSYAGISAGQQQQQQQQQHPPQSGPTTPRTKHVSFARSHTLTSFDDVNLGLRSSGRCKAVSRSQERLIGGKKPMMTSSAAQTMGETAIIQTPVAMTPSQYQTVPGTASMVGSLQGNVAANMNLNLSQNALHSHSHMHPAQQHAHMHGHHGHSHHHGPQSITHIHQFVQGPAGVPGHLHVQTEQPLSTLAGHSLLDDYGSIVGMSMNPPSPEVVVVEKKFRNAMKTQATQTDVRKEKGPGHFGSLSPHGIHKVTLVSQGAQTNGLVNGKKLAKSLSEMNNENILASEHYGERPDYMKLRKMDHEAVHRTQSEEPPRSPLDHCSFDAAYVDSESNINYYKPPPPLGSSSSNMMTRCHAQRYAVPGGPQYQHAYYPHDEAPSRMMHSSMESNITTTESHRSDGFYPPNGYDFESNSLPRRACSHHRTETEFTSNSLPRRDHMHQQDMCKHITECSELLAGEPLSLDLNRMPLLPPPRQYCKEADYEDGNNANEEHFDDENDLEEDEEEDEEEEEEEEEALPKVPPIDYPDTDRRRMSMVAMQQAPKRDDEDYTPFRRDDYRRQSMPVYVKQEKLIDGPVMARSSLRLKGRYNAAMAAASEEKEIFIDFKPHISAMKFSPNKKPQKLYKTTSVGEILAKLHSESQKVNEYENVPPPPTTESDMDCEEDSAREDPLYENIQGCMCKLSEERQSRDKAMDSFRKRSVSLDSGEQEVKPIAGVSAPPSPGRDDILANASTYPSSDSLANDVTRDHSDGIWNESQVTILTAEQRDISDSSYNSNLHLLTPTTRRKHLILQHQQQRSSIDTDALDLEEQFTDHSPTYSNTSGGKKMISTPTHQQQTTSSAAKPTTTLVAPSIAVTPSSSAPDTILLPPYNAAKSPNANRRKSNAELRTSDFPGQLQQKNVETLNYARIEAAKFANADVSECSTNTEEYATCTDTSKRTPGIKTPPTITSSSSTTQVPVSTQSSQITDKTHGGSSFESASSLYSTKGELLPEDLVPQPQAETKFEQKTLIKDTLRGSPSHVGDLAKASPAHSLSSVSSGSFNHGAKEAADKSKESAIAGKQTTVHQQGKQTGEPIAKVAPKERPKIKPESVSDDERSELRYSSSGYYESPHDEDEITKVRRFKQEEERNNRRRSSMKLDIERENIRALTSPIKKSLPPPSATSATTVSTTTSRPKSPEASKPYGKGEIMSPSRIKRFRPKIRRQFRKQSRDESTPRRTPKKTPGIYTPGGDSTEKLLDLTLKPDHDPDDIEDHEVMDHEDLALHKMDHLCEDVKLTESATSPSSAVIKSSTDTFQLKAKSIESLRSVSPGSDSVFYSEAGADQHSHCLHCGKEMEGQDSVVSGGVLGGDSVESLPCIEHESGEHDIVKPPSDFADSPVTTKTTQRLYKKMDKRFRSEERYHHGDRGRLYRTRQENIRAKSEERSRDSTSRSPQMLRPAGSSPCVLPDIASSEQNQHTVYRGNYDAGRYTRLTDADVWTQLDHQSFDRQRERRASTDSERSFHTKYQVILHRLVQRRCTLEMYHRQKNNKFRVDKTIVVKSDSGEFGFRIHGSKPVVVAAIEPDTPAESSGLEVGDIIISVNGVQVLDKHHTEVVKIAHDGCEKLELQVARTIGVLMSEQRETPSQPIYSGFLWRQSGQAKGTPNSKKWVRRWFCLRPDNCLYYYKTENDNQPVGAMIMAKHTVEQCPPEIGKPFGFKIDSGEGIPMYVAADSDELANRWMKILKQSANQDNTWLDKCARNLYQQPSSIIRPDCFGYLMKLGSRWCGWSKRYCVLKDACLYFYQDANSKAAFGLACLHGYKVASMSTNAAGRKNSFEIIPPDGKLRHYYFSTESEMDKKRWISALEYSIDRWIKSG